MEVENDRVQETQERYGDAPKITNEATREELDRDRLALGVPGSLSNRPVPAPGNKGAQEGNTAQRSAMTRQFAYDRTVTTIQRARGQLRKQNVAVALNSAAVPAGQQGWSAADLSRMEALLRGGLGIDEARGDKLVVSAMPFPGKPEPVPWWAERDTISDAVVWATYAVGALLAYLLLARPLLRVLQQSVGRPREQEAAPLEALPPVGDDGILQPRALPEPAAMVAPALPGLDPAERGMPVVPLLEDYDLPPPGSPVDVMVNHLRVLAGKEPERVAEVVKQWVQKNASAEH